MEVADKQTAELFFSEAFLSEIEGATGDAYRLPSVTSRFCVLFSIRARRTTVVCIKHSPAGSSTDGGTSDKETNRSGSGECFFEVSLESDCALRFLRERLVDRTTGVITIFLEKSSEVQSVFFLVTVIFLLTNGNLYSILVTPGFLSIRRLAIIFSKKRSYPSSRAL